MLKENIFIFHNEKVKKFNIRAKLLSSFFFNNASLLIILKCFYLFLCYKYKKETVDSIVLTKKKSIFKAEKNTRTLYLCPHTEANIRSEAFTECGSDKRHSIMLTHPVI